MCLPCFLMRWSVTCCQDGCIMGSSKAHCQKSISVTIWWSRSFVWFSIAKLTGSLRSLSTKSLMVLPLPPSKTNTSYKAWRDAVRWLNMRQMWSLLYPGMRASPSTCRVLAIDWHVRGLYYCLWCARGVCLCPRVITPRGFTSLPTQEAEYSFSCFIPTNKHTKQTNAVRSFLEG